MFLKQWRLCLGNKNTWLGLQKTSWFGLKKQCQTQAMNSDLWGQSPGLFGPSASPNQHPYMDFGGQSGAAHIDAKGNLISLEIGADGRDKTSLFTSWE